MQLEWLFNVQINECLEFDEENWPKKKNRIMSKELISFSKNYMKFAIAKATSKRMDTQLAY